jgi:hypothetical protein
MVLDAPGQLSLLFLSTERRAELCDAPDAPDVQASAEALTSGTEQARICHCWPASLKNGRR